MEKPVEKGDQIFVLAGRRTAYILRKTAGEDEYLVGLFYLARSGWRVAGRDGGVATTDAAFEHHLMGLDRQIEAVRLSRKMVAFFTSKEVCML